MKPARLGSSVGISKAHDEAELAEAVALAFRHDEKVLVEEFVDGIEVEVGVLGNRDPIASVPGEIVVTNNEWYDYEAKYVEGEMELIVPARISPEQLARAQELAVRAFVVDRLRGDGPGRHVRPAGDGEVLVNELNTIPGFTETSVYAKLFEALGDRLRRAARAPDRPGARAARAARRAPVLNRRKGGHETAHHSLAAGRRAARKLSPPAPPAPPRRPSPSTASASRW